MNSFSGSKEKSAGMTAILAVAGLASLVVATGTAVANCDNYGWQFYVGSYECNYQHCDMRSGAAAGGGLGGAGGGEVAAGATAGTQCNQGSANGDEEDNLAFARRIVAQNLA